MERMYQRLLFLAASMALLAVCWKAAPGEGAPAPAAQTLGTEAGADRPEGGPAWNTPFYTYCDEAGNLQLELYFDQAAGQGRGTRYVREAGETAAYSFSLSVPGRELYMGALDFLPYKEDVSSCQGTNGAEMAEDYQEFWEYDAGGKPVRFFSQGFLDDPHLPEQPADLITVDFFYREDGSLCRKSYSHNAWLFGTTGCSAEVWYDALERPAFANCYITHGSLEYYYIYAGEDPQPDCCLCLDFCGGDRPCAELHAYA